ncbi:hypothetical protein [Symbiopectobacterium purcellii]|uniref:Uncharacterized protein n=1 Tax=Symbiopectobacterium purcellii TaxID=2871826 RepID=A0ABX9ANE4_9ENTR|nr:hypothetical protein [Symbiopectobacterium purcellii]QZN94505.1 hypothetical protein K6K13_14470 [Symbiopectobacterium purcellii]
MQYVTVVHKEMAAAELVFREIYLLSHLPLSVAMGVTVAMLLLQAQRALTAVAREPCSLVEQ